MLKLKKRKEERVIIEIDYNTEALHNYKRD